MLDIVDYVEKIENIFNRVTRNNISKLLPHIMKKCWTKHIDVNVEAIRTELERYSPKPSGHSIWNRPVSNGNTHFDLSIIIPFYNTQKYAVRCIESVISQKTEYSVEIILIDDGSPDKCGEILNSYSHHKNIRVIHQANKGLSGARNAGVAIAQGEYLLFVDSDDLLCDNAVQELLDTAYRDKADIVEGAYVIFGDHRKDTYCGRPYKKSTGGEGMSSFAWGKVIRSSLFDNFCFPEQYYFEDTTFAGALYKLARVTVTIPQVVLKYYVNYNGISLSSRKRPKSIDTYYIIEELILTWRNLNIPINNSMKIALIYQLSSYVYHRTKRLGEKILFAQFILSCDLLEKNDLYPSHANDFYVNEAIEAFKNRQFGRWKYAAKLL